MAWKDYIPLVGDAVNFIGGLWSNKQNAKENQKNREWSEKMWHLNNEYNLPVNQIQRFQDAGLNPALAYGEGTSSLASYAGNMSASRGYENPAKFDTAQIAQLKIQDKIADSEVKKNDAEAYKATAEGNRISTENDVLPERLKHEIAILGYEDKIKNIEAFVKDQTYGNEIKILYETAEKAMYERELTLEQKKLVIQQLVNSAEEFENLKKQGKVLEAEEAVKKGELAVQNSIKILNLANAYKARMEASKVPSEIALNRANARKAIADALKADADIKLDAQTADKIANDIEEQLYNGNTERVKKILETYGTGPLGTLERNLNDMDPTNWNGRRKRAFNMQRKATVKSSYFNKSKRR